MNENHGKSAWVVPALLWLLASVTLLSGVVRLVVTGQALVTGVMPPDPGEAAFVHHPGIAALHILPGIAFMALGPLQFIPGIRQRRPGLHRWSGRVFITAGALTAVSALVMNVVFPPVGGPGKESAVYTISVALLAALAIALSAILHRDVPRHRAWMIRAFAIGLSISTQRLYFIPMFALYGMPDNFTIGLGMWLGLLVNVAAAELILLRERRRVQPTRWTGSIMTT